MGVVSFRRALTHEELFEQRYGRLLAAARSLAASDPNTAADLVHEAFVQFALVRPDVAQIQDLDAYLFVMLRNLHLSRLRRAARVRELPLSAVDYDSARLGLCAVPAHSLLEVFDQLVAVARYLREQRQSSRPAGVLILRFFHGFYPSEIVRVLKTTPGAVHKLLHVARTDVRAALTQCDARVMEPDLALQKPHGGSPDEWLDRLRRSLFEDEVGPCLGEEQLKRRYREPESIDTTLLAHLTGCRVCLDQVAACLGLPLLAIRLGEDRTARDTRGRRSGGPGAPSTGGSNESPSGRSTMRGCRPALRDVFEHRPEELRIAINGLLAGTQRVAGPINELVLHLAPHETIAFIEIFSEQDLRLLLMNVSPPETSQGEQAARVVLSDARALDALVSFADVCPILRLRYVDPLSAPEHAVADSDGFAEADTRANVEPSGAPLRTAPRQNVWHLHGLLTWSSELLSWHVALRHAFAPALLILLIAMWWMQARPIPVSAAELLQSTSLAEVRDLKVPGVVVHRVWHVEARRVSDARVTSRRRVELWRRSAAAATAWRVFDEQNVLRGGIWTNDAGSTTTYPGDEATLAANDRFFLRSRTIWRVDLSASAFVALVGSIDAVAVADTGPAYVLSWHAADETAAGADPTRPQLLAASLTLAKRDGRPIQQTLRVREGMDVHEYRFVESAFERVPAHAVRSEIFERDVPDERPAPSPPPRLPRTRRDPEPPSRRVEPSADVELEAWRRLASLGLTFGDAAYVRRDADGSLRLHATVDGELRGKIVSQALEAFAARTGLQVEITVAPAAGAHEKAPLPQDGDVLPNQSALEQLPAFLAIRARVADRGSTAASEIAREYIRWARAEARAFGSAREALRAFLHEWPVARLTGVGPDAIARWQTIVRDHVVDVGEHAERLRTRLAPVLFVDQPPGDAQDLPPVREVADAGPALDALAHASDEAITALSRTFRAADDGAAEGPNAPSGADVVELRDALLATERLAGSFAGPWYAAGVP